MATVVHWKAQTGLDTNNGTSDTDAVKTWSRVLQVLAGDEVDKICSVLMYEDSDEDLSFNNHYEQLAIVNPHMGATKTDTIQGVTWWSTTVEGAVNSLNVSSDETLIECLDYQNNEAKFWALGTSYSNPLMHRTSHITKDGGFTETFTSTGKSCRQVPMPILKGSVETAHTGKVGMVGIHLRGKDHSGGQTFFAAENRCGQFVLIDCKITYNHFYVDGLTIANNCLFGENTHAIRVRSGLLQCSGCTFRGQIAVEEASKLYLLDMNMLENTVHVYGGDFRTTGMLTCVEWADPVQVTRCGRVNVEGVVRGFQQTGDVVKLDPCCDLVFAPNAFDANTTQTANGSTIVDGLALGSGRRVYEV